MQRIIMIMIIIVLHLHVEKIANISYPFRLRTDPPNCGDLRYNLSCENNNHSTILYLYSGKYYVEAINYNNYTIRVVDFNIVGHDNGNCSSIPRYSLFDYNFSGSDPYLFWMDSQNGNYWYRKLVSEAVTFLKCEIPVESPLYKAITTPPCTNRSSRATTTISKNEYAYVKVGKTYPSELHDSCRIEHMAMITSWKQRIWENSNNISYKDLHNQFVYGFELSWLPSFALKGQLGEHCYVHESNNKVQCGISIILYIENFLLSIKVLSLIHCFASRMEIHTWHSTCNCIFYLQMAKAAFINV